MSVSMTEPALAAKTLRWGALTVPPGSGTAVKAGHHR